MGLTLRHVGAQVDRALVGLVGEADDENQRLPRAAVRLRRLRFTSRVAISDPFALGVPQQLRAWRRTLRKPVAISGSGMGHHLRPRRVQLRIGQIKILPRAKFHLHGGDGIGAVNLLSIGMQQIAQRDVAEHRDHDRCHYHQHHHDHDDYHYDIRHDGCEQWCGGRRATRCGRATGGCGDSSPLPGHVPRRVQPGLQQHQFQDVFRLLDAGRQAGH